jgi:hypothetical protein
MFTIVDITKLPLDRFTGELWPFLLAGAAAGHLRASNVLLLPETIYGP